MHIYPYQMQAEKPESQSRSININWAALSYTVCLAGIQKGNKAETLTCKPGCKMYLLFVIKVCNLQACRIHGGILSCSRLMSVCPYCTKQHTGILLSAAINTFIFTALPYLASPCCCCFQLYLKSLCSI